MCKAALADTAEVKLQNKKRALTANRLPEGLSVESNVTDPSVVNCIFTHEMCELLATNSACLAH